MFNTYSIAPYTTIFLRSNRQRFVWSKLFSKVLLCVYVRIGRRSSSQLTKHLHNSQWLPPTIGNPFRRPQTSSTNTSHPASIQSYTATWKSTPLPCPRPLVPIQSGPIAFFFEWISSGFRNTPTLLRATRRIFFSSSCCSTLCFCGSGQICPVNPA